MRADISLLTVTAAGDRVQLRLRAVGRLADDRVNRSLMARVVSGGGSLLGTGFLSVEHLKADAVLEAGADDARLKPSRPDRLLQLLARFVVERVPPAPASREPPAI